MTLAHEVGAWLDALPLNRRHWTVFAVCSVAFLFDAFDFQVIALAMPWIGREWGLNSAAVGWVLAATPAGMLAGTFLFGVLSDRIGRRPGFQITLAIFSVFSAACAAAQSPAQLMVLRFLAGVGIGGFLPVDTAVMSEFMPARSRGKMLALWAIFFSLGNLIAAFVGRAVIPVYGWRVMFLLCLAPAALIFAVRRFVPETPHFLLAHGDLSRARQAVAWIGMGAHCPALDAANPACVGHVPETRPKLRLLFAPALRRRTAVAWIAWITWSFSYFGLLLWLPALLVVRGVPRDEIFLFVVGYTASGIVGRLLAASIVDRIGRKPLIVGGGLISAALLVAFGQQSEMSAMMLCGFALAVFQDGSLGTVATFTPELFPTGLRASGTGAAAGVGRVATMLSPLAVGAVVAQSFAAVFAMFAASFAIGAVAVAVLARETRGVPLDRVAATPEP